MFRLKEQQLHMLIWLMAIASVLLFCVFGMERKVPLEENASWKGMDDFSDGWICTYETTDEEKYKAYQKENVSQDVPTTENAKKMIVDVVTFPADFSVKEGTSLVMTHTVPDIAMETVYMMVELENAGISVYIDDEIIYSGKEKERMLSVCHRIPILPEYKDQMITIEISDIVAETIKIEKIQSGIYNQLWVSALKEDGMLVAFAAILFGVSICLMVVYCLIKNVWLQKRLLLFSIIEGFLASILCLSESEILPLIMGGNYGIYILKACIILLSVIVHLTVIRSYIYKKKVLSLIDTAILLIGILYISVMVLQAFSLLDFDMIYIIGIGVYGTVIVLFTVILAITLLDYGRKEVLPIFIANLILLFSALIQGILFFIGKREGASFAYIEIGFGIYMIYIWINGLRQAFCVKKTVEETTVDESLIRAQIVESMNPNLLFASFQTLQNLIKSGSDKSIKMIYYISVYFRGNLKALEAGDEIISFADELEHIIAYLQLQKTRNQNLEIAIECKTKEFNVPRHSLEPLVENAVKHGIAKKNNMGNVAVRTYTRADGYAVQIIDDGVGFDVRSLKNKKTTLAKKLALLEKTCKAKTEVVSKDGKGTVVTIVLPMLENDLMDEV